MNAIEPEVMSTKEAWTYCGGRATWEELRAAYPALLGQPFRRKGVREQFLRTKINTALRAADLDGKLVEPKKPEAQPAE